VFISKSVDGVVFVAEPSRRSSKYLWSRIRIASIEGFVRVEAREVPIAIRARAYDFFEYNRLREARY
jgi:hypothetical protein